MRCKNCGTEYPDEEKSCPHCGDASLPSEPDKSPVDGAKLASIDTSRELVWKYSLMDLLDEFFIFLFLVLACGIGYFFFASDEWLNGLPKSVSASLFFAIPALYLLWQILRYFYNIVTLKYELKPRKFYYSHGLWVRKIDSLALFTIRSLKIKQNLFQRFLNLGDIYLYSPDLTSQVMKVSGIADVWDRFNIIETYRQANQDQRARSSQQDKVGEQDKIPSYRWRYSGWDLCDETFWTVVATAICLAGGSFLISLNGSFAAWVNDHSFGKWSVLGFVPAILWLWLIYAYISRRYFVSYELTPTTFIRYSGVFVLRKEIFVLYYLRDIQFNQNLWQRFIRVGNVTLFLYDSSDPSETGLSENDDSEAASDSKARKVHVRGLKSSTNAFKLLDEYRQRELHKYTGGPV